MNHTCNNCKLACRGYCEALDDAVPRTAEGCEAWRPKFKYV